MKLSELLAGQEHHVLQGDPARTGITAGTTFDADRVTPGSLFIAVPGHREGGPDSVAPALARGAAAVLVDATTPAPAASVWASAPEVCVVRVPDTRTAAAVVASRYFGEPGRQMDMVAITGTNGKTSVSYMVESVLRISEGAKVGVIGTMRQPDRRRADPDAEVGADHAGVAGPAVPAGVHARPRSRHRGTGSHVHGAADAPGGPYVRRRRRVHQPDAGSPGRSRNDGELPGRQAASVPGLVQARCGQRRRPGGQPASRR